MTAPTTYADWSNLLEAFGRGDDTAIDALQKGTFVLDAGTAVRFYSKVNGCYTERKKLWQKKFDRLWQQQSLRSVSDLEILLFQARTIFQPIAKFCRLSAFPQDLQKTLLDDLESFVSEIRNSLKEHASKQANDREKALQAIKTFTFYQPVATATSISTEPSSVVPVSGRKILF